MREAWLETTKLRELRLAGQTLDEIAAVNAAVTGYEPTRAQVAERLGETVQHADEG